MDHSHHNPTDQQQISLHPPLRDYVPLGIVFTSIVAGTLALMTNFGWTLEQFLALSMGLFFLLFALFKMLDLTQFAHGYREYDIIAKHLPAWGYAYPFAEAMLGIAYLAGVDSPWLHVTTIVLAGITCLSVGIKLAKREVIQCACLGSLLKVPITYVSLAEYAVMGAMAAIMILL